MDERSDRDLVDACRRGDEAASAGLVAKCTKRILAICYGTVGNADDAEDLAQETLIKGLREVQRLRDAGQFYPWNRFPTWDGWAFDR